MERREFIKTTSFVSSAFVIGFYLPTKSKASDIQTEAKISEPNAFVRIDKENKITFLMGQAEMGQGTYTTLAMCIAEELDVKWEDIEFEAAKPSEIYYHAWIPAMLTGGSSSITVFNDRLRKVGAALNIMLKQAAAKKWQVRKFNVKTENSKVINKITKESFNFGDLVEDLASVKVPTDPKIKPLNECKLIGKPTRRHPKEAWAKVTGEAEFGIDIRVPNMKYAVVIHPTIFGAKVKSFDATSALKKEGILKVKQISTGIAIIAEHWWTAKEAVNDINVVWDEGAFKNVSSKTLDKDYSELLNKNGNIMRKDGDSEKAFKEAAKVIEAEYNLPFLAHAAMEPLNAVVHDKNGSAEVWTGGQLQSIYRDVTAKVLGIESKDVTYNNTYLGGGFGRRAAKNVDYILDAAQVSKGEAWPIMTLWTREDDIKMGNYRPLYKNKAKLALDKEGKITSFDATVVGQSVVAGTPFSFLEKNGVDWAQWEGLSTHPYDIKNHNLQAITPESPISVQWWRSVGHTQSGPMVEGIIDFAAKEAKIDPIEYRLDMLTDLRHIHVLEDVAKLANWKNRKIEKNVGYGVSFVPSFGSIAAMIAKVRIIGNDYKVEKVWTTVDCGFAFNPLNVENQMISGINFGLAAVKYSEITLNEGMPQQSNFYDYEVSRISDAPEIEINIINSSDTTLGGIGEVGTPPIFAAVANALFDATGKKYTNYPIKNIG
ncbi:twin-arginine translocation pathway signal protein [Arcobacter sp. CECT 8989]|nr:molybdopterin cofactor-binding domain-containing protein [Arcobacter sp. CECT 8989]RXJ98972.1 twin-arginine translocation pathway signal protein [Arcobacter sp. CECT 8989]